MSITSNVRSYAESAQSQINDVTGQANEFVTKLRGTATENVSNLTSKANGYVTDLRTQAEKAVNLEAIKAAVEPYLAQAKGYSTSVTDRAEELYSTVKNDKRVAKLASIAEEFTGTVVETVQVRVVKPVQSLTGLGAKKPAAKKPAAKATTTATKPVAKKAPVKKAPAKKAAARA
jgi:hypothetical protein